MKLILCSLLICGILSYLNVSAAPAFEEDDGGITGRGRKIDTHECTGQYLKRKGKLSQDEPTGTNWSMCVAMINAVVYAGRRDFEDAAKEVLPNELDCVMREYEKNEVIDFVMKTVFYQTYDSLSESDKKTNSANIATEGDALVTTMSTACGIEQGKFNTFLGNVFTPRVKSATDADPTSDSSSSDSNSS